MNMNREPNLIVDESELVDFNPTPMPFTGFCTSCGWTCGERRQRGKTSDSYFFANSHEEAAAKIKNYHDTATECAAPSIVVRPL